MKIKSDIITYSGYEHASDDQLNQLKRICNSIKLFRKCSPLLSINYTSILTVQIKYLTMCDACER